MSKKEYYKMQAIINKKERQAYRRSVTDIFCGLGFLAIYISIFVGAMMM